MRIVEMWWTAVGEDLCTRPVLQLTRNESIQVRANVTVAPITTRVRGIPTEVSLGPDDGLPRDCLADLHSLPTVRKALLRERIETLSRMKLAAVEDALRFALGI